MLTLMDTWLEVVGDTLLAPFLFPIDPLRRIYWLYVASAVVIAVVVWLRTRGATSWGGILHHLFPRELYRHRSSRIDYRFFYVNAILCGLILAPLVAAPVVAGLVADALGGYGPTLQPAGLWASAALTLATVLAMDFALYVGHYLQHRVPLLWEFHKIHHSAETLTPLTAFRVHPVDDLLTLSLSASSVGIVQGLFHAWFGTGVAEIYVLGVNAILFGWYALGFNLRHSHIWLSYPAWLSHILISPAQHQIHHSREPRHFDKNMGFIFAFWDAIWGTLYVPRKKEEFGYGLSGEDDRYSSVGALYARPFLNLWATWRRRLHEPGINAVRPSTSSG
jgi:sterol desaturase/sphingolipid hydroxylase (fatty acid hydroxylase superfamily)